MMVIAAGWITVLLLFGGVALDRSMTGLVQRNFDDQLSYMLNGMIASAEVDQYGEIYFNRPLGDQRFLEPNSGLYWQITGAGHDDFPSRSLWDRSLHIRTDHVDNQPHSYDSNQFAGEKLRIMERSVILPGSETKWWFVVAQSRTEIDGQIHRIRLILVWSFLVLGLGLFLMAGLQTWYGLGPLRRVRLAIKRLRTTGANRVSDPLPLEVQPLVEELNALLAHTERQAEEARMHAGNLAHALKTPLTVLRFVELAQEVLPAGVLGYWLARGLRSERAVDVPWAEALNSAAASGLAACVAVVAALPIALLGVKAARNRLSRWAASPSRSSGGAHPAGVRWRGLRPMRCTSLPSRCRAAAARSG